MHWKNCNEIKASSRILHFWPFFCLHFVMSSRQIVKSVWRLWRVGGVRWRKVCVFRVVKRGRLLTGEEKASF